MTEPTKPCGTCVVDPCACAAVMRVCEAAYEQGRRDGERGFPAPATVAIVRAALAGAGSTSPNLVNSGCAVNSEEVLEPASALVDALEAFAIMRDKSDFWERAAKAEAAHARSSVKSEGGDTNCVQPSHSLDTGRCA